MLNLKVKKISDIKIMDIGNWFFIPHVLKKSSFVIDFLASQNLKDWTDVITGYFFYKHLYLKLSKSYASKNELYLILLWTKLKVYNAWNCTANSLFLLQGIYFMSYNGYNKLWIL